MDGEVVGELLLERMREKPLRYAIEPHSRSFCCSHWSETGLVRKSLQPAASAETRSTCSDEAVRATMMTGMVRGGETGLLTMEDMAEF